MMRKNIIIGLLITLTVTNIYIVKPSQADTLRVLFYEIGYPPLYYSEDDPETGIYNEIFSAINKITKDKFVYKHMI